MAITLDGTSGITATGSLTGLTTPLAVNQGGTGAATLTANNVLLGNGTSAVQAVAPGTNGNVLTSNGTTWTSAALPAGGVTSLNGQTGAITNTDLDVIGSYFTSSDDTTLGARTIGSTYAGSTLLKINSAGARVSAGLSGTWRMLGANENSANTNRLYVRIS